MRVCASLLMGTESATEAQSIVDNTLGENGLEALGKDLSIGSTRFRRMPTSSLISRILNPRKGNVEHMSFHGQLGGLVRRQDKSST